MESHLYVRITFYLLSTADYFYPFLRNEQENTDNVIQLMSDNVNAKDNLTDKDPAIFYSLNPASITPLQEIYIRNIE